MGRFRNAFSLFIILAPIFLPKQQVNNKFNFLLIFGGRGMQFIISYSLASIFNAINWLSPVQFVTLSMINALIAYYGGADVAGKR